MSIYPWSVLFSDANVVPKVFAFAAIVTCILLSLWLYHTQKGRNLTKKKSEKANIIANTPKRGNSSSQLPDTTLALSNKPDNIPDTHISKEIIAGREVMGQSQFTNRDKRQSKKGRTW